MPGKKQKGQAFERQVCGALSNWVSGGKESNLFWRSSQSGGRATVLLRKGERLSQHAGDICAINPDGEPFAKVFFVEAKFLKTLRLDLLLYDDAGVIGPIWTKVCNQAHDHHKLPILIAKENSKPVVVCLPTLLWNHIARGVRLTHNSTGMHLMLWTDFVE